ncbi:MAG: type II secretion system ATPase GspE [Alphaproteobacteria bacterium]|nr:type II secretion system ATPase GspE [Alphaproteobacteria bacterium]
MALETEDPKFTAVEDGAGEDIARSPLLDLLVENGKIDHREAERVNRLANETHEQTDILLTRLGLITEEALARLLSQLLGMPLVERSEYPESPLLENQLEINFLREYRVLPLAETEQGLVVAMANPLDDYALSALRLATDNPIVARVGIPAEIEAAFEAMLASGDVEVEALDVDGLRSFDDSGEDINRLRDLASEAPVIRLVNSIIGRAVETRASDIHIEPFERALRVRYRIDGVLRDMQSPSNSLRAAVISRVKLMANLNIAETRLPQDGRIRLVNRGKEIDLRISTVPTMHGESVVLRILDKGGVDLGFDTLGFSDTTLPRYLDILDRPHGIVLVTGPTGSGKTTSLYTSLLHLNNGEKKILTVEDPVEYQLDGVNQVQVKAQIGLTFANALRSFLRQDPDIIMIGEIRDVETAEIAVQAALTGHKVLSTVHTNDAPSTITRLLDMGIEDFLLTSTVNGITAQRLVRKICDHCREPIEVLPEIVRQFSLERYASGDKISLFWGRGCEQCGGTGYRGRTSILEVLEMTDPIRSLILQRAESQLIKQSAIENGMKTMHQDGLAKALSGVTTLDEVLRVTHEA